MQPRLAAYALGEVEADVDLLNHLAECPACQRDLRAYVQVARMLPYDAPDIAPPPGLRERILSAVAESAPPAAPDPLVSPAAVREPARAAPAPARWRWRLPSFRPALAFALALAVALLGWNISLQRQLGAQSAQISANRESWQTMIALLNASNVHWYKIAGGSSTGHVWAIPQGQVACLVAEGLPPIAADQVYQVWLRRGAERTSGGIFDEHYGNGWILIRSSEPLESYDSVGVTVEPRGGSAAPSGPAVLQGTLAVSAAPTIAEKQQLLGLLASP
jgi:hypothetical protein